MKGKRYSDPYLAGIGLGLVLLSAYVFAGRGLGASGAFSSVASLEPLNDWLVWEVSGMMIGGFVSAWLSGRLNIAIERGPAITNRQRIVFALAGGTLMGIGAKFARGCTSGQGLTGGALLSAGSWIFIATCFASAYMLAPVARRLWR